MLYRLDASAVTKYKTIRGDHPHPFVVGVSFQPDNRHLVVAMGSNILTMHLYRVAIDTSRTEPIPLDVPQAHSPVISRQGDKLVFTRQNYDENLYRLSLRRLGVAEGTPTPFATSTARDSNPNISPDGKRVAFASFRTGAPEIYICDAAGGDVRRLTSMNAAVAGSPRFSPDGKWLAFDSRPLSGEADIYIMSADGGPMRRLTSDPAADTVPTWSRDGAYIYFQSNRSGSAQVWKMKADGSNPVQITHGGGYIAFEGVDGRSIYYSKRDSVSTQMWTTGVNGGEEKLVVNTLYRHNFSPAASGIYLSTATGLHGGPEILYYRFADGTVNTLYRLSRPVALGLTVARDESWLLFSQLDGSGSDLMIVENFR